MKLRKSLFCFPATNKYNKKISSEELREKLCKFELWKNFSKIASLHCKIKVRDDEAKSVAVFSIKNFSNEFPADFFIFQLYSKWKLKHARENRGQKKLNSFLNCMNELLLVLHIKSEKCDGEQFI